MWYNCGVYIDSTNKELFCVGRDISEQGSGAVQGEAGLVWWQRALRAWGCKTCCRGVQAQDDKSQGHWRPKCYKQFADGQLKKHRPKAGKSPFTGKKQRKEWVPKQGKTHHLCNMQLQTNGETARFKSVLESIKIVPSELRKKKVEEEEEILSMLHSFQWGSWYSDDFAWGRLVLSTSGSRGVVEGQD